ncbi:MAG: DUF4254 domain-containing protein [Candidatus Firestonebacteria bacterium]
MKLINSEGLFKIYNKVLSRWHRDEKKIKTLDYALGFLNKEKELFNKLISDIVISNCFLWHEEDKARAKSLSSSIIASIKHTIDGTNQYRANKVEEIDKYILDGLTKFNVKIHMKTPLNSETPGAIVDRLSILALKIYHMAEQTKRLDCPSEHIEKCKSKLNVLLEQKKDLSICFNELINDLLKGKKRLKMYYQFKMYNDPSTNSWMKM